MERVGWEYMVIMDVWYFNTVEGVNIACKLRDYVFVVGNKS